MHCRELLEKLSPWNTAAAGDSENLFLQLLDKMTHIQSEDSLITFTEASLPSFEMNSKLLNFIENRVMNRLLNFFNINQYFILIVKKQFVKAVNIRT